MTVAWHGFAFLVHRPSLWRLAVLPVLLNILITAITLICLIGWCFWLATSVHPWFSGPSGWMGFLALVAEVLLIAALLIAGLVLAILVWKILSGILCGYFYARLCERVERELGVAPDELSSVSFRHEVVDAFKDVAALIGINAACVLLNLVPFIGGILAVTCCMSFTWFILGLDFLAYPLALRGVRRSDQWQFAQRHAPHTLGLGAATVVFGFLPLAGALLLTSSAVGAVLLHRRIGTMPCNSD